MCSMKLNFVAKQNQQALVAQYFVSQERDNLNGNMRSVMLPT